MIGQPVDSTNLASVDYDEWSATLTVEFRNDTVYEYYGVPPGMYAGLMRASALAERAFAAIPPSNLEYAATAFLAETFALEDHPDLRPLFVAAGISTSTLDRVLQEGLDVDPKPAADR